MRTQICESRIHSRRTRLGKYQMGDTTGERTSRVVVVDSGPQISVREIKLRELVRTMLHLIGENPEREGLEETPRRVAAAWLELTRGYAENPALILERTFNSD